MSVESTQNNINHSDLKEMYSNIGRTYEQPTNSFGEKAKKVGKIALGILFLIGAFISYPFHSSKNISTTFEQLTGLPPKASEQTPPNQYETVLEEDFFTPSAPPADNSEEKNSQTSPFVMINAGGFLIYPELATPLQSSSQVAPTLFPTPNQPQNLTKQSVESEINSLYPVLPLQVPADFSSTAASPLPASRENPIAVIREKIANTARKKFQKHNPPVTARTQIAPWQDSQKWNNVRLSIHRNPALAEKMFIRPPALKDYDLSIEGQQTVRPTNIAPNPRFFLPIEASAVTQAPIRISRPTLATSAERESRRLEGENLYVEQRLKLYEANVKANRKSAREVCSERKMLAPVSISIGPFNSQERDLELGTVAKPNGAGWRAIGQLKKLIGL
jgi:hypothetical protein